MLSGDPSKRARSGSGLRLVAALTVVPVQLRAVPAELSRQRILRRHNSDDVDPGTRRSFYQADLVGRAPDQDGNELFMAAEAFYTAGRRDADRVVRNAEFLTRFTGVAAVVVASRQNNRAVQELVDDGGVLWFEFSQRDLLRSSLRGATEPSAS